MEYPSGECKSCDALADEVKQLRTAIDHALRNLLPIFESDPPSVKQAAKILREAIGR